MKFSAAFQLHKSQSELDFVDIEIHGDTPLFVDPYPLSQRTDIWSLECHHLLVDCFQSIINAIRERNDNRVLAILLGFSEPNETHLGLSRGRRPRGRGLGREQAQDLHQRLRESRAVHTGFLRDLEDCQLVVPGINRDKVSDITTNIIRGKLAEYTAEQCDLHNIRIEDVSIGPAWDPHTSNWVDTYGPLPVYQGRKILLVPKSIARYDLSYDYVDYYNRYVLEHLRATEIHAGTSLVQTLKNGKQRVTKRDLKGKYPLSKDFLYEFSRDNPQVMEQYKGEKAREARERPVQPIDRLLQHQVDEFVVRLRQIRPGNAGAGAYHDLMVGILEAIFYPSLMYPKKEEEIHEGRKRIDITYRNADQNGFFFTLSRDIPCPFIMVECKNYRSDIGNEELDQMAGRFSPNRGQFGLIVCRSFEDKDRFMARCRDTAQDHRGFIIPLDDEDIERFLNLKAAGNDREIDRLLVEQYRRLVM